MKKIFLAAVAALALCGCGGHSHNHEEAAHEHIHVNDFVAYTHGIEFFMQHEGLEVGKKSCITLYATSLSTFKPVECSEVEATLKVDGKTATMTSVANGKGVFHFDFVPETAGEGVIAFDVAGEKAHFHVDVHAVHSHSHDCDGHEHGEAHVHEHGHDHDNTHAHNHSAHDHSSHNHSTHSHGHSHPGHGMAVEGKPGDVAFSKEQSWKIEFATAEAVATTFNGAVKVVARVESVPTNFTTIVATASGKLQYAGTVVAGKQVSDGEVLFYLEGSDVTENDAAVKFAEAESNYELAKAEFERKKLLFIDKIVSEREYLEAEASFKQAEARYTSMQRTYGGGKVLLKSSMNGYIAELLVANGDYVQPGTPVARIERKGNLNIAAELPVRYASQLQSISNVNIETAQGNVYSLAALEGHVLAVGSSANSCNMLPLTLSVKQMADVLPGSIVTLYITSAGEGAAGVAVPRTAIVEEMGSYFVFVQNSPISFEKRSVELGATDGHLVKVNKGVHKGERIVTKGAVVLKLSQGAAALDPHAGHVH